MVGHRRSFIRSGTTCSLLMSLLPVALHVASGFVSNIMIVCHNRVHLGLHIFNHPLRINKTSPKERLRDEHGQRCERADDSKQRAPCIAFRASAYTQLHRQLQVRSWFKSTSGRYDRLLLLLHLLLLMLVAIYYYNGRGSNGCVINNNTRCWTGCRTVLGLFCFSRCCKRLHIF